MPEWDDYETYNLNLTHKWEDFSTIVNYRCFTDRAESVPEARRIDAVELGGMLDLNIISTDNLLLDVNSGAAARFFGDWRGMFVQTGWHGNVDVARQVPDSYESNFVQLYIPLTLRLTSPSLEGLELKTELSLGWPLELYANIGLKWALPESIMPVKPGVGYKYGIFPDNSQSYKTSMLKQTGFYLSNSISFWPLKFSRIHYFQQSWGTGSLGFYFSAPETEEVSDAFVHLVFSGITHQSYGIKIEKPLIKDLFISNLCINASITTLNGWVADPLIFPAGGRFSTILAGAAPTYILEAGPIRMDFSAVIAAGFRQNNYYTLAATVMTPELTEKNIIAEAGISFKLLFPFLYRRMIGPAIDVAREWRLFSLPEAVETGVNPVPYRLNLSLAVTGSQASH